MQTDCADLFSSCGEKSLAEAAAVIGREPVAIQLRYLQTLAEIAKENNSTIIFPVPVDMLKAFMSSLDKRGARAA